MPHKRAKRSVREKNRAESGADLVPGARKSIENEEIPKSAARVLNAAKIQQDWAAKKRKQRGEAGDDDGAAAGPSRKKRKGAGGKEEGASTLRIQPGESIAHFNRRVEDSLRPAVREAMQSSSAKMRRTRKEEEEEKLAQKSAKKAAGSTAPQNSKRKAGADDDTPGSDSEDDKSGRAVPLRRPAAKDSGKAKEFERILSSAPKRLNDVVQAPPQIKAMPRKAKKLAAQNAQKAGGAMSLKEGVMSMAQKAMMEEERDRVIRLYREMKRGKTSA